MKFTEEVGQRIITALRERLPEHKLSPCGICGTNAWSIHNGYVRLSIQKDLIGVQLGGSAFPLIALICTNCGNTHLLNLKVLGLEELTKPDTNAEPTESEQHAT
jgi:hypothetical protein